MRAAEKPLEITVTPHGENVVVALSGSATMERCDELNDRLVEIADGAPAVLVLDMAELDFICSLGLGSVVAAFLRAERHGGRLVISGPRAEIEHILEITKLNTLLPVFESVDSAIATA